MQVDEQHFGKQVRCPICNVVLTVAAPVAAPVLPRDPVTQAPPEPPVFNLKPEAPQINVALSRQPGDATTIARRMRMTRVGLGFHYSRLLLVLISVVCVLLLMLLLAIRGNTNVPMPLNVAMASLIAAVVAVILLCVILIPLLSVTGSLLCLGIPGKTQARVWIILSFGVETLGLLPLIASLAFALATVGTKGWDVVKTGRIGAETVAGLSVVTIVGLLGWSVLTFAAWTFFALFVRRIFVFMNDSFAATETFSLLVISTVMAVLTPVWLIITPHLAWAISEKMDDFTAGEITIGILLFVWAMAWVWILLRILTMVKGAREKLEKWL
jgi:hypothetical protein